MASAAVHGRFAAHSLRSGFATEGYAQDHRIKLKIKNPRPEAR
jgi:hypothetical protein